MVSDARRTSRPAPAPVGTCISAASEARDSCPGLDASFRPRSKRAVPGSPSRGATSPQAHRAVLALPRLTALGSTIAWQATHRSAGRQTQCRRRQTSPCLL